ncbi:DMT family transporter [Roseomonas sp. OT10]|uniref:DMT family transporter n=1 Tax=Roseomonas cutis TaxID=2897332 RepID=UPI001E3927B5|nr:DMT family transporter [Roseomonas sp. OT10]UFN51195.1 DMT family transporter [Roseomonas sp. OT10]
MSAPIWKRSTLFGLACLVVTAIGWGLNWPATKMLLRECPPLSARGVAGLAACAALFMLSRALGENLVVPRPLWGRLVKASLLNVTAWMGFATLSLLWLDAGEAATLAYTTPVWAALFAWPILGERPTQQRTVSFLLGFGGIAVLLGGSGWVVGTAKLPGVAAALAGAVFFGLGAVLTKRWHLPLAPLPMTAWQVGIGCLPLLVAGLTLEHADFAALPPLGWAALAYTAAISLGLCYLTWFAALRRLPASTATLGTLLTPVVGVTAAAWVLGESLGMREALALLLILSGIVLAMRR